VVALAIAAIFPLGEMVYEATQTKRLGVIAIVSFIGIVVGFGLSFATGNAIFALLKDSLFTCVFGLLFLGSLATARPLIYRLNLDLAGADRWPALRAKRCGTARRAAGVPAHDARLGCGSPARSGARVVAAIALPIASATAASPIISVFVIGTLLAWTVLYARARRASAARALVLG